MKTGCNYKEHLKLTGKISRETFYNLFTKMSKYATENINEEEKYYKRNLEVCSKCPKNNTSKCLNTKCDISNSFVLCKKEDKGAFIRKLFVKYEIEDFKLSKFKILAFLYYHFCNISNNGYISVVDEALMAKFLGCSITNIRIINNFLEDKGLISYERIGIGLIAVQIKDYYFSSEKQISIKKKLTKDALTEKYETIQEKKGFYELGLNWFKTLIKSSKTTNHLRIALYKTAKYLDEKAKRENRKADNYYKTETVLNYKEIIKGNFSKKSILDIVKDLSQNKIDKSFKIEPLFISILNGAIDTYYLIDKYIIDNITKEFKNKFNKKILNLLQEAKDKSKDDLFHIAKNYGINTLENTIKFFISKNVDSEEILENCNILMSKIKEDIEFSLISKLRKPLFSDIKTFVLMN